MNAPTFHARAAELAARADWPECRHWEDAPDKRIKIQFRAMPDADTAKMLRAHGFRFVGGPAQFWVRALNRHGQAAAATVTAKLATLGYSVTIGPAERATSL